MRRRRVIIMGAAGRDFHNFNVVYRDDPSYEVVAFTAAQIPNIAGRRYPPELAGPLYPDGIPIFPEEDLPRLIREYHVDEVVFAYSDVSHQYVMERAAVALAGGADYRLMGPRATMLKSRKPVVSVCAVRTGSGKSQTTRYVVDCLRRAGYRVVVVRHPMPYGDLTRQRVQRFAVLEDLDRYDCTIEEREEYEPHLRRGVVVYAGVDYAAVLEAAEREADVLVWDGGNNDWPFFEPTVEIVVADPHRAGHERTYYPGSVNFLRAHIIVINKVDTASLEQVQTIRRHVMALNPSAVIVDAASPIFVEDPDLIRGRRVLVVEDGPTLTHGEMAYGAGLIAAMKFGAAEVVDPRPYAVGSLVQVFQTYGQLTQVLPAMGYGRTQMAEMEETIRRCPADVVVMATPVDLRRIMRIEKPAVRVTYELQPIGQPTLEEVLLERLGRASQGRGRDE
jgi:predicted GTPase